MTAPAAPLEKEREALRIAIHQWNANTSSFTRGAEMAACAQRLLAAFDADPWWSLWQKTYRSQREAEDRLEKAETLVRAIVSERHLCFIPTNIPEAPALMNWDECARRYFARLEVPE